MTDGLRDSGATQTQYVQHSKWAEE